MLPPKALAAVGLGGDGAEETVFCAKIILDLRKTVVLSSFENYFIAVR